VFFNTGGNSDTLRGADCKRHMFHVETQNAMYLNGEGFHFLNAGLVEGKKWYLPTADYAFGHDLLEGAKAFLKRNGGEVVGDDLVSTDATDFSAIMLKIPKRQARCGGAEPRGDTDYRLSEAVQRIWAGLPYWWLWLRHPVGVGRRATELQGHLAQRLEPPDRQR